MKPMQKFNIHDNIFLVLTVMKTIKILNSNNVKKWSNKDIKPIFMVAYIVINVHIF